MTMHSARRLVAVACLELFLVGVCPAFVQAQAIHEGKLTGTVASEDHAVLPGATVEISSPALIAGTRSATTSENGTYLFLNLPLGRYTVTTSLSGFKKVVRENIEISPDATTRLDVVLPVGGVEETVTVSAEGPIVDTKTSTIDTRFDSEMLAKLPTSRDAFYDLALTAPGMSEGSGAPSQSTEFQSPTAYGSATNENVFLINGVDATSPRAGSFGSLVNVNYDAVEEVRIVSTGSKAEYASYSGAAIDVLTKSGSNQFHGTGAWYSKLGTPADNSPDVGETFGTDFLFVGEGYNFSDDVKKDWEGSFTLGGPIAQDRLWFFGAFDYQRNAGLRPRWSLESESWGRYADAKISAAPSKNHRAFASYHYENNDSTGGSWGSEPEWDTTMTYGTASVNHTPSAQWQWFPNNRTTVSGKYPGLLDRRQAPRPHGRSGASRIHQLVEVGVLRHQWGVPVRRGAEVEPADDPGRPLALRRRVPRPARHQVWRPVHKGSRQLAGGILPELRELPLPVPLDPERTGTCRTGTETRGCVSTT